MLQLRAKTKALTCPPLSIARYSLRQLSQLGLQWRERKCPIFETVSKVDSNPGSLDCESGILPLSYRAIGVIPTMLSKKTFHIRHAHVLTLNVTRLAHIVDPPKLSFDIQSVHLTCVQDLLTSAFLLNVSPVSGEWLRLLPTVTYVTLMTFSDICDSKKSIIMMFSDICDIHESIHDVQ